MKLVQNSENFIFAKQLPDGREDRFLKLELIDTSNGSIIGVFNVNHTGSGTYEKKDLPANTNGVFLARYTVYKDFSMTQKDRKYAVDLDYFRVESIIEELTEVVDFGDGSTV